MKIKEKSKYKVLQNLNYTAQLAWRHSRLLVIMAVVSSCLSLATSLVQLYIAPIILQKVEQSVPLSELLITIGLFTAMLIVCNGAAVYLETTKFPGEMRFVHGLTKVMIRRSCETSYPNQFDTDYQKKQLQAYIAVFNEGGKGLPEMIPEVLRFLISLIGFMLFLMVLRGLHPFLLGVIILTSAISYFIGRNTDAWGYNAGDESMEIRQRKTYIINLAMANEMPKDIRIFGMRKWLDDIWNKTLELWRAFCNRCEKRIFWTKAADVLLAFARNGIAYFFLIRMVLTEDLPASEFLLYFSAVSGFTNWITILLNSASELNKISLQICRFREYMDWPEPFKFEEGKPISKNDFSQYELQLEDVSFCYPESDTDIISHMNLTIRPGEKLAIVGLNGAGKTTLIKLLCGFLDPTEGRVLLNGHDIREFNRKDYYTLFTAVFQDFSRLQVTIAQNIAQSISGIDQDRITRCVDRAGLTQALAELPNGLDTMLGKIVGDDGIELSGGQLQRLMLARALYKDAPILLLDEPTAALDPIAENEIYQKYNEMTHGRTSVYISHRVASTRFCDRIIFLADGNIAEEGSHDELMALGGGYCNLFNVQSKYYREGGTDNENQDELA